MGTKDDIDSADSAYSLGGEPSDRLSLHDVDKLSVSGATEPDAAESSQPHTSFAFLGARPLAEVPYPPQQDESFVFTGGQVFEQTRIEWLELKLKPSNDDPRWIERRWITFIILTAILVIECPVLGVAANSMIHFRSRPEVDPDPMTMIVVVIIGWAESALLIIAAMIFVACRYHFFFFLIVAVCAASAFTTGIFTLVLIGMCKTNSFCDDDPLPGDCEIGMRKALASGCLRILWTAPIYATATYWYFFIARREAKSAQKQRRQEQQRRRLRWEDRAYDTVPLVEQTR